MKAFPVYGLTLLIIAGVWFVLNHLVGVSSYFLPGMGSVFESLIQNTHLLWFNFLMSFAEASLGLVLALLFACFLGVLCYFSKTLLKLLHPLVLISQALPMLAIAPLIVLWLGIGLESKLVIVVLSLFFPIFATFVEGLEHVNPLHLDLAYTMQATKIRKFYHLVLPSVFPYLAAGIKISVTWSILAAIVAEWVGGSVGLGFLMQNALSRLDTPLLFASLVLLVVGTLLFYGAVSWVLSLVLKS